MKYILVLTIILLGCVSAKPKTISEDAIVDQDLVVLLHGFGRSSRAMEPLAQSLKAAGFGVVNIEYESLDQTIAEIDAEVSRRLKSCCAYASRDVHFVGHSLGGLLIRSYLGKHYVSNLGRVVLLGSPNKGTEMVDAFKDEWWFSWLGPAAIELGTHPTSFPNSLKRPYYELGIIAGDKSKEYSEEILAGADDGLVTVESTKVDGMRDFIVVNTTHSQMRADPDVAQQTISFLRDAKFNRVAKLTTY